MLRSTPFFDLFGAMWRHAAGNRRNVVLFMTICAVVSTALLFQPYIIGRVFENIQYAPDSPDFVQSLVRWLSLLLGITVVGQVLYTLIARTLENSNAYRVRAAYKTAALDRILQLPASWHRDHHSGDTIDKLSQASDALYNYSRTIFVFIEGAIRLAGSLVLLAVFDWRMSLLALCVAAVTLGFMHLIDERVRRHDRVILGYENFLAAGLFDFLSNVVTVITLRLRERAVGAIGERAMRGVPLHERKTLIAHAKWAVANVMISSMIIAAILIHTLGSYRATGTVSIGVLFMLYSYLSTVGSVFFSFADRYSELVRQHTTFHGADPIEDAYRALVHRARTSLPAKWKELEIRGLSFSYGTVPDAEREPFALKDIRLSLRRGERVAFVGTSGSGKSTMLLLLRGLYPADAEVRCDGRVLPDGLAHLSERVTLIPQDPEIFNATVEENVTMGLPVEAAEVERALDLAQFSQVAAVLPHGLRTSVVEKGVSLSGGQRQRLALARGLLAARSSDILLLDEPTSSVDAPTEVRIYEGLFDALPETTVVSCVHRLHLLDRFDRVYLFSDGRIVSRGTPDEVRASAEFQHLWAAYLRSAPSTERGAQA